MGMHGYGECCHERAGTGAAICGGCGRPLLRCPGFTACSQLLAPDAHCPVHVQPCLEAAGELDGRLVEGEHLTLPLRLLVPAGGSQLRILSAEFQLPFWPEWKPLELGRSTLYPGTDMPLHVDLPDLKAGRQRVKVRVGVQVDYEGVEEIYVFDASVHFQVAQQDKRSIHIAHTQNIDNSGANFEAGAAGVVQTGDQNQYGDLLGGGVASPMASVRVDPLRRNRDVETQAEMRGYAGSTGLRSAQRVGRAILVDCRGFQAEQVCGEPRPFLTRRVVPCGRNSTSYDRAPSFLRLLYLRDGQGAPDPHLSRLISGVHLELLVQNDRLCVRDQSTNGTWLNGTRLEKEAITPVEPNSVISLLNGHANPALEIQVRFEGRGEFYDRVVLQRRAL